MNISADTFLKSFSEELKKREQAPPAEISAEHWACRESAAVLTFFQSAKLNPLGWSRELPHLDVRTVLRDDLTPAPGLGADWFLLKPDIRRGALERLGSPARWQDALAANPERSTTPFQKMYELWLSGKTPDLQQQDYEELTWSAQIAGWMDGLLPDFPKAEVVRTMCQRQSVYALFSHLASESFTGREKELATLREFVGVLPPEKTFGRFFQRVLTWFGSVAHDPTAAETKGNTPSGSFTGRMSRQLGNWLNLSSRQPLVVEGTGGVGKSALLARLLNEHFEVEESLRFPFAYLPLDSPSLRVEEPFTLLAECTRQLQLLQPNHSRAFLRYQDSVAYYRDQRAELEDKSHHSATRSARNASVRDTEYDLYSAFAGLVNDLSTPTEFDLLPNNPQMRVTRPLLLVLDTFEEAAFRGREGLLGLFRLLEMLQRECPTFRLLVFTRPPFLAPGIRGLEFKSILLGDLTPSESVTLLNRLGVEDPEVASSVASQIGGNPLNLQLAARVLKSEDAGSAGITGLKTKNYLFFSVGTEVVRGRLYERLLGHIHDSRVRSLAHPGMVMRKIDPSIIRNVLSEPCGVPVKNDSEAYELCDALAQEHTLVKMDAPEVLRFRPDIRIPVLELLRQDRPRQVAEIHRAAANYYGSMSDIPDRAEAIYHRLALGEEEWLLEQNWQPEFGPYLASALEELPLLSQGWLASKLGLDISPEAREHISLSNWETITGRKVLDLLRFGEPADALALLKERDERTPQSSLFAYEAKAHIELGNHDQASAVLTKGVDSMQGMASPGRLAELYWLLSQVEELRGDHLQADFYLGQAEDVSSRISTPLARLQILLQRVILRRDGVIPGEPLEPIRRRLALVLESMSDADLERDKSLSRAAATVLGPGYMQLFTKVISQVGFGRQANGAMDKLVNSSEDIITGLSKFGLPNVFPGMVRGLQEAWTEGRSLERLLKDLSSRHLLPTVMPALQHLVDQIPVSLGGANLAGIEDYRESWENQISAESA